jgi:hypothetical protein
MTPQTRIPARLSALVDHLVSLHDGDASREEVVVVVQQAVAAVSLFGPADDGDLLTLTETIAERDLRLRLGIEREVARLDPETRRRDGFD